MIAMSVNDPVQLPELIIATHPTFILRLSKTTLRSLLKDCHRYMHTAHFDRNMNSCVYLSGPFSTRFITCCRHLYSTNLLISIVHIPYIINTSCSAEHNILHPLPPFTLSPPSSSPWGFEEQISANTVVVVDYLLLLMLLLLLLMMMLCLLVLFFSQ